MGGQSVQRMRRWFWRKLTQAELAGGSGREGCNLKSYRLDSSVRRRQDLYLEYSKVKVPEKEW